MRKLPKMPSQQIDWEMNVSIFSRNYDDGNIITKMNNVNWNIQLCAGFKIFKRYDALGDAID